MLVGDACVSVQIIQDFSSLRAAVRNVATVTAFMTLLFSVVAVAALAAAAAVVVVAATVLLLYCCCTLAVLLLY